MAWTNKIYTGDCLYILNGFEDNSVDLIYLDPPFNSNKIFSAPIGSSAAGSSFDDMWSWKDVDLEYLNELIKDYPFMVNMIQTIDVIHSKSMKSYITYMAQRIIQMKRVLKETGSFYLHCDPTASHYLKLICDRIFGKKNFKNELIWKRSHAHNSARKFGPIHDVILYYSFKNSVWNNVYQDYEEDYKNKYFKFDDNDGRGRYWTGDLTGSGTSDGSSGNTWRGFDPTEKGRHWAYTPKVLDELDNDNRIYWPPTKGAFPKLKRYLNEAKGVRAQDLILDVPGLSKMSKNNKESTGYPTQKPVDLIKKFILASSNEGDLILDPFCGCATACVAADQLNRRWIGIDISPTSAQLVASRIQSDAGLFTDFIHIDCIANEKLYPKRKIHQKKMSKKDAKNKLYESQKGKCNGCSTFFEIRHFHVDHIIPKSKNGPDSYDNYQLLCGSCNQIKGDRTMHFLNARLSEIENSVSKLSFGEVD